METDKKAEQKLNFTVVKFVPTFVTIFGISLSKTETSNKQPAINSSYQTRTSFLFYFIYFTLFLILSVITILFVLLTAFPYT